MTCQNAILPDNKTMNAREILIAEIQRQPEPVVHEVLHYDLKKVKSALLKACALND